VRQFADGRAENLADQVLMPFKNPVEMGGSLTKVLEKLTRNPTYLADFVEIYGTTAPVITRYRLSAVLTSFIATIRKGNSIVDRINSGTLTSKDISDPQTLSQILRGSELFKGKGRCSSCHSGPNFTDELFHNTGTGSARDRGLATATGRSNDINKFKTPGLRSIAATGPYFHDGRFASLLEVINHYDMKGSGAKDTNISPEMRSLGLTEEEKIDLIFFISQL
jgi:cytochrome c peroxidase